MLTLPNAIVPVLSPFATLFRNPTWLKAQVLLVGAILAPGQRTVASALRVMGLSDDRNYARYQHVLNRAVWSPLQVAQVLLGLLIQHLDYDAGDYDAGPLVFGIDETVARRGGPKINARGIYRAAVRSSRSYPVKVSGLRWICLMWLGNIPWAGRYWALPVLTALAPSAGYYRRGITDGADALPKSSPTGHVRLSCNCGAGYPTAPWRWWETAATPSPCRGTGQALDLLHFCQSLEQPVTLITRLRLDAGLYEPAPTRQTGQNGRPRVKGPRLPTLQTLLDHSDVSWITAAVAWYDTTTRTVEITSQTAVWYHTGKPPVPLRWILVRDPQGEFAPQALLCTDPAVAPVQILEWFVLRWQLEVTFTGSYFHGDSGAPGRGNPAPVVRPGHRPHHAGPPEAGPGWGFSPGSPWRPTCCKNQGPLHIAPPPGMPSQRQPSWMPSPWCVASCGLPRRVLQRHRRNQIFKKSRQCYTADSLIRWPTRLECTKSSLAGHRRRKDSPQRIGEPDSGILPSESSALLIPTMIRPSVIT